MQSKKCLYYACAINSLRCFLFLILIAINMRRRRRFAIDVFSKRQRFIYLIIEDNWLRNCYISLLFSRNCTNFISMQISSIHYKLLIELSLSLPPPPLSLSCCLTLSSMCFKSYFLCAVGDGVKNF
jgi:hypothetical protein